MRKLKLDVDALCVETFVPDARESGGGSVVGHAVAVGPYDAATVAVTATIASWQEDCFSVLSRCETCGLCTGYSCLFTACWWCETQNSCRDC
jgi:hypothetical protein